MKPKRLFVRIIIPLLLILACPALFAQNKTISGKVTDSKDGSPLSGISVVPKGSTGGTVTGSDGSFSLTVSGRVTTLIFSSIGFATKEIDINGNTMAVTLTAINASLNEVVVVAYGSRKKGDLTGAVTSVSAKDFQKGAIASTEQLLQGKVAGLQVTTGGGSAGGGSNLHIRGTASLNASNAPLIVIDGVPVESNGIAGSANLLNTINPDDVESVSIFQDAN